MISSLYISIVNRLSLIGIVSSDDKATRNAKNLLVYLAILMSFGGVMWGTILLAFGIVWPSIIPYGYVVVTIFNLLYLSYSKNFPPVRAIQILLSMLLPFALQWALGGFLSSGVMMLWSTLSLIGAITLLKGKGVYTWLFIFIGFTVFSIWFDSYIVHLKPVSFTNNVSIILIGLNMLVITSIIFVLSKTKLDQDLLVKAELDRTNKKLSSLNKENLKKNKELLFANQELKKIQQEIAHQRDMLEISNKDLFDYQNRISRSIKTAKTIQQAFLPTASTIQNKFEEHFILFKPKDIVSGDFYWMHQIDNKTIFIEADCTGHGVPGAFMTLIGNAILNQIVQVEKEYDPAGIMQRTSEMVKYILNQDDTNNKDGMDLSVLVIEEKEDSLQVAYGAANQQLNYVVNNELFTVKGTRKRIGGITNPMKKFKTKYLELPKTATLYLCSDGFSDQNNPERQKFGSKNFRQLLNDISHLPLVKQRENLLLSLKNHQQNAEQRDDITVVGLRWKSPVGQKIIEKICI